MLARDGRVIEGVNVENAAYPLGVCAERTALSRAVAEGYRPGDFAVAAITASPCGGCRQWLLEMGVDRVVFRNGGRVVTMTPDELLPEAFDSSDLAVRQESCANRRDFGAVPCPLRADFLVMLAVGGGPGCPRGRRP